MKLTALIMIVLVSNPLYSADSGNSGGGSEQDRLLNIQDEMQNARSLIESMKYRSAIRTLYGVVNQEHRNADAWNLLGYSHRKLGKMKGAWKAYRKALKYNPEHKGALEYQGELFIQTDQLDKAQANRDKLAAICPQGCDELAELDKALSSVK